MLEEANPDLARFGKDRLDGKVAYLATIRADGSPRAHPVTPIIGEGHVFVFVDPGSPRTRDLLKNQDYCLHCAMNDSSGSSGEFQITGIAENIEDSSLRSLAESVSSFKPSVRYMLFELLISDALSTTYRGGRPIRQRWQMSKSMIENL